MCDGNLSEPVLFREQLACPCSRMQPAGPFNLWRRLTAPADCKLQSALEAAYTKTATRANPCRTPSVLSFQQHRTMSVRQTKCLSLFRFPCVVSDQWRCVQRAEIAAKISKEYLSWYVQLREAVGQKDGGVAHPMALIFDSAMGSRPGHQTGTSAPGDSWAPQLPENITRPADDTALCFMPVSAAVCQLCWRNGSGLGMLCASQCTLATCPSERCSCPGAVFHAAGSAHSLGWPHAISVARQQGA